jgi:hypothetical protein
VSDGSPFPNLKMSGSTFLDLPNCELIADADILCNFQIEMRKITI